MRTPEPARTAFLFPSVGATQVDRLLTYETQLAPGEVREPWQWHTPPSLARTLLVDEEPLVLERTAFSLLIRKLLPGDASPAEVQEWADLVARLREVYPREIPREVRERARQHASGDDLLEARPRLTREAIQAALAFAGEALRADVVYPVEVPA